MKKTLALFCLIFLANHTTAMAQDNRVEGWQYTVGAGVMLAPTYLGDDSYQLSALPNVQVKYEDKFFASVQDGAGYNVINTDNWRIGPIVKYNFGRDEDGEGPFQISGDTDDLRGLGDFDGTVELGGYVEYTIRPMSAKLELVQGVGGHEGFVGNFQVSYAGKTSIMKLPVFFSLGPKLTFADSNFHDAYFGVNATQSAESGLSQYDADAGILSYGVGGTAVVPLNQKVSAVFIANYGRLGGESADSSLVEERGSANQGVVGAFVNYTF